MRKAIMFTDNYVNTRARLVSFFWADTDTDVFHCRYPMPIFLHYSNSTYFASWDKIATPGAILPSGKHFQTTAERHYSAYFSSDHINKQNHFTSYNYFMRQDEDIHSCYALWGKIYTPGAILPPAEHDWLNWSHDTFGQW